jgi:hypothetical protein
METISIYSFDELSEEAKIKAIEKYRNNDHDDFDWQAEPIIEDFSTICDILGITLEEKYPVSYSVGYRQSDYSSFFGQYKYKKGALSKIMEYAPKDDRLAHIAKSLQKLQRKYFYKLSCDIARSYRGESMRIENIERSDFIELSNDDYKDIENELEIIFIYLAHWLYKQLCEVLDFINSDDYIKETLIANEYKFLEDGRMI